MYRRCLFCQSDLGANPVLEAFPVGRRLAFDGAKGRLWVVCPRCERWNLTPLEERWEAIDAAERLVRDARRRVATDNIALARVGDDTELVRVGRAPLPELAAWRYGDQFGRRQLRRLARTGAAAGVVALAGGAFVAAGPPAAVLALFAAGGLTLGMVKAMLGESSPLAQRWVPDGAGHELLVTPNDLPSVRLAAGGEGGWTLKVPYNARRLATDAPFRAIINRPSVAEATLHGAAGLEVARRLLPLANGRGASAAGVREAVRTLESLGPGADAFARAASRVREWSARQTFGDSGSLVHLPAEARLALEMAAHEERERAALEGELAALERAWQDAERIAAIADDLAVPDGVRHGLERLRNASRRAP